MDIQDYERSYYDSYSSESFHFHAPSEHTIEGAQYDLEMHIVLSIDKHRSQRDHAVLAFLFTEDDTVRDIPLFNDIIKNFNQSKSTYQVNFGT